MIKAKFIKATPIEGGITYILKGERTKDALRAAVDLDNEDCTIDLAFNKSLPDHDSIWEFAQGQARDLDARLRAEFKRGQESRDDFSATLVKRFDKQIEDGKPFMGNLENSCKTNK